MPKEIVSQYSKCICHIMHKRYGQLFYENQNLICNQPTSLLVINPRMLGVHLYYNFNYMYMQYTYANNKILYKYRPVMRAIWRFMDISQYCCQRSIKPILPDIIGQYMLYYMSNVYGSCTLVYGYIYCQILLNNLPTFPVLKSGAWCYYCEVKL